MPKFSGEEREAIAQSLLKEGERLFCAFGLKKVTVDELARAASIAKGSFYAFYSSKEALYFSIISHNQQDMWLRMAKFLKKNAALPPRQLMKATIGFVFGIMGEYPLVQKTDSEIMAILLRKLPKSATGTHTDEDAAALQMLEGFGVRFTQPIQIVAKAFQALYSVTVFLQREDAKTRDKVLDVMTDGLVQQLVEAE